MRKDWVAIFKVKVKVTARVQTIGQSMLVLYNIHHDDNDDYDEYEDYDNEEDNR